jgi:hypothetical protein
VAYVSIPTTVVNEATGERKNKGFAFLEFDTASQATAALAFNGDKDPESTLQLNVRSK